MFAQFVRPLHHTLWEIWSGSNNRVYMYHIISHVGKKYTIKYNPSSSSVNYSQKCFPQTLSILALMAKGSPHSCLSPTVNPAHYMVLSLGRLYQIMIFPPFSVLFFSICTLSSSANNQCQASSRGAGEVLVTIRGNYFILIQLIIKTSNRSSNVIH